MKKFLGTLLAVTLLFGLAGTALAADPLNVNGLVFKSKPVQANVELESTFELKGLEPAKFAVDPVAVSIVCANEDAAKILVEGKAELSIFVGDKLVAKAEADTRSRMTVTFKALEPVADVEITAEELTQADNVKAKIEVKNKASITSVTPVTGFALSNSDGAPKYDDGTEKLAVEGVLARKNATLNDDQFKAFPYVVLTVADGKITAAKGAKDTYVWAASGLNVAPANVYGPAKITTGSPVVGGAEAAKFGYSLEVDYALKSTEAVKEFKFTKGETDPKIELKASELAALMGIKKEDFKKMNAVKVLADDTAAQLNSEVVTVGLKGTDDLELGTTTAGAASAVEPVVVYLTDGTICSKPIKISVFDATAPRIDSVDPKKVAVKVGESAKVTLNGANLDGYSIDTNVAGSTILDNKTYFMIDPSAAKVTSDKVTFEIKGVAVGEVKDLTKLKVVLKHDSNPVLSANLEEVKVGPAGVSPNPSEDDESSETSTAKSDEPVKPTLPEGASGVTPVTPKAEKGTPEAAAAKLKNIEASDLEATTKGVKPTEAFAKKAFASQGLKEDGAKIHALPVLTATVGEGKVAALGVKMKGSALFASRPGDMTVLKLLGAGQAKYFGYVSDPKDYADGKFTLLSGPAKTASSIEAGKEYTLVLFVKDGGDYDLGEAKGTVGDPVVIVKADAVDKPDTPKPDTPKPDEGGDKKPDEGGKKPAPGQKDGGSSSGCDAGFAGLALLLAAPLFLRRRS